MGIQLKFDLQMLDVFPRRIAALKSSPDGTVAIATKTAADAVLVRAVENIGQRRYSGHHLDRGPQLKDSGLVEPIPDTPAAFRVVFRHPAARVHHEGASGHSIGAPGKILFNPNDPARPGGGPFFARSEVHHPGFVGNPYLTKAATETGLRPSGALRRGRKGPFPIVRVR